MYRYKNEIENIEHLLKSLDTCKTIGCEPMVILNGEYYTLSDKVYEEIKKIINYKGE